MKRNEERGKAVKFLGLCILKNLSLIVLTAWLFYDFQIVSLYLLFYLPIAIKREKTGFREQQKWLLTISFKDALLYFKNALTAGYSAEGSLVEALQGLEQLYGQKNRLTQEFRQMKTELSLGVSIEQIFKEFALRCQVEEISLFTEQFYITKRTGGSLADVIQKTSDILQGQVELKREFRAATAAKITEFHMMCIIPHAILCYLRLCSPSLILPLYQNLFGTIFMTVTLFSCLGMKLFGEWIIRKTQRL